MKRKILVFGIVLCMLMGLAVVPVGAEAENEADSNLSLNFAIIDAIGWSMGTNADGDPVHQLKVILNGQKTTLNFEDKFAKTTNPNYFAPTRGTGFFYTTDTDGLVNEIKFVTDCELTKELDYYGNTLTLSENSVLDIGENLYFRNGYVDASNGYIKTGDRKITGSNIYFTDEGKIRVDDGENAKIMRDNGNETTDQGFVFGISNPSGIIKVVLDATGEAGGTDYTGKTVEKEFDFTGLEIYGLTNFGFAINNIPKPIELTVKDVCDVILESGVFYGLAKLSVEHQEDFKDSKFKQI